MEYLIKYISEQDLNRVCSIFRVGENSITKVYKLCDLALESKSGGLIYKLYEMLWNEKEELIDQITGTDDEICSILIQRYIGTLEYEKIFTQQSLMSKKKYSSWRDILLEINNITKPTFDILNSREDLIDSGIKSSSYDIKVSNQLGVQKMKAMTHGYIPITLKLHPPKFKEDTMLTYNKVLGSPSIQIRDYSYCDD